MTGIAILLTFTSIIQRNLSNVTACIYKVLRYKVNYFLNRYSETSDISGFYDWVTLTYILDKEYTSVIHILLDWESLTFYWKFLFLVELLPSVYHSM